MEGFSLQMPAFTLGGLKLTMAVPLGWIITGIGVLLLALARIALTRFEEVPKGLQNFIEFVVEWAENVARKYIPERHHGAIIPYLLTLVLYIALNGIFELVGMTPVIYSLSATFAMGLFTFFWINWYGFRVKGFAGRFKALAQPVAFVAPFKLISDLAVPVSMAGRLFGNVLAGPIVMTLIYGLIPIGVPAILACYFTVLHMIIQGYIFVTLTLSFIQETIE